MKSDEISYSGKEAEIWLSEIPKGMKMNYKADSNQLGFLQLLSAHATQNVTFHCKNTIAYFDNIKNNHRRGLKLMTWNDNELLPKGPQRLRYEAHEDGCQHRSDVWSKTVISYTTEKSSRLPLTDVFFIFDLVFFSFTYFLFITDCDKRYRRFESKVHS